MVRHALMWVNCALILAFHLMPTTAQASPMICGTDLSFVPQVEAGGGLFYDDSGASVDVIDDLAAQGLDMVRLRLWHTPADGVNGLDSTLIMARRIHDAGMRLLLDIHYSDTWADPAHQTKPAAWENLPFDALTEAVHDYTAEVVSALVEQGTPPAIIQIGNEITPGILWEDGRVQDDTGWLNLIALLNAGVEGAHSAAPDADIMLHIDSGGNAETSRWFFDHIGDSVDFDLIGVSFYPWWHGELGDLQANLTMLAERYGKPIIVVETGYPWTLGWADDTHNMVGEMAQLHAGFPATPRGQHAFLTALTAIVADVPDGLGRGLFYWEPATISAPEFDSFMENLTLFDYDGHPLPGLSALVNCGG